VLLYAARAYPFGLSIDYHFKADPGLAAYAAYVEYEKKDAKRQYQYDNSYDLS